MFVVDTNVLIYAADGDSPHFRRCRELVERWRAQQAVWFTTWPIVYEFLRVVTHPRVMRRPWTAVEAWAFVDALLDSPGLEVLTPGGRHRAIAAGLLADVPALAGNILHDAHTAVLMREHGVSRIVTRDTDFFRFTFLKPIDPLTSEADAI